MILEAILMGGIMIGAISAFGFGIIIGLGKVDDWEKKMAARRVKK